MVAMLLSLFSIDINVDESSIYTREVIESALRKKASALIFAHHHPTGPAELRVARILVAFISVVDSSGTVGKLKSKFIGFYWFKIPFFPVMLYT